VRSDKELVCASLAAEVNGKKLERWK